MKIEPKHIPIRDLVKGYTNNENAVEEGVTGWSGKLDIRPKYQREFVYNDKQQKAVVDTVRKGFPINSMFWSKKDSTEDHYEVLDGQQRTISICNFVDGKFSIKDRDGKPKYFENLTKEEQEDILNYELVVYFCEGSSKEKLEWFETINIAGKPLNDQELRNAAYTGTWLTSAKTKFSKTNCIAYNIAHEYMSGVPIQQEYLAKALDWISGEKPADYMADHQHDQDANELWQYFENVFNWVKMLFPNPRKDMKSVAWGELYNEHKNKVFIASELEKRYDELTKDEEVECKNSRDIYYYLFTGNEKFLNLRSFNPKQKQLAFNMQQGVCLHCKKTFTENEMHADHIVPWSKGGKTTQDNCQVLCEYCNKTKSNN